MQKGKELGSLSIVMWLSWWDSTNEYQNYNNRTNRKTIIIFVKYINWQLVENE